MMIPPQLSGPIAARPAPTTAPRDGIDASNPPSEFDELLIGLGHGRGPDAQFLGDDATEIGPPAQHRAGRPTAEMFDEHGLFQGAIAAMPALRDQASRTAAAPADPNPDSDPRHGDGETIPTGKKIYIAGVTPLPVPGDANPVLISMRIAEPGYSASAVTASGSAGPQWPEGRISGGSSPRPIDPRAASIFTSAASAREVETPHDAAAAPGRPAAQIRAELQGAGALNPQVSIQVVEHGLQVIGRFEPLGREHRERMRDRIAAFLSRHGLPVRDIVLNGQSYPISPGNAEER